MYTDMKVNKKVENTKTGNMKAQSTKTQNTKVRKTREALRTAALALVEEHPIQEVTVSELCKRAGINRTTFYKYYSVPSDVLEEYLADVQKQIFSSVKISQRNEMLSLHNVFLKMCLKYYTDPLLSRLYTHYHHRNLSFIEQQITSGISDFPFDKHGVYFIAGGVDGVLTRWIEEGFCEKPEEIAQKLDVMVGKMIGLGGTDK